MESHFELNGFSVDRSAEISGGCAGLSEGNLFLSEVGLFSAILDLPTDAWVFELFGRG